MTAPAAVDQLTATILDDIDKCRYRRERAALRVQFRLANYSPRTPTQATVLVKLVQPVLDLWDKADSYCGNPVGEWGSAYVPADYVPAWGERQANELRWDAREHVRIYLTELLDGEQ